jgi:hypothetical protein
MRHASTPVQHCIHYYPVVAVVLVVLAPDSGDDICVLDAGNRGTLTCQRNPRNTTHISKFGVVAGDDELALALQNNGKGPKTVCAFLSGDRTMAPPPASAGTDAK